MLKQTVQGLGAVALLAIAAPSAASAQMGHMPEGKEATVQGTVIDLDCKFRAGQSGEGHRMCAQVCADKGLPLAILGNDGKLYMPVGGGMPGDPQNDRLKEFAEQEVTISGKVYEAGGAMALEIARIRRS
jgi:hypothetical protein